MAKRRETARGQVTTRSPWSVHRCTAAPTKRPLIHRLRPPTGWRTPQMSQSPRLYRSPSESSQRRHLGKKKKTRKSGRASTPKSATSATCSCRGMSSHKADRSQRKPAKSKCDECGASLLRLDTLRRRKQEHCKYRHRRNGGGGSLQSPSREGSEGGEGGIGSMGG